MGQVQAPCSDVFRVICYAFTHVLSSVFIAYRDVYICIWHLVGAAFARGYLQLLSHERKRDVFWILCTITRLVWAPANKCHHKIKYIHATNYLIIFFVNGSLNRSKFNSDCSQSVLEFYIHKLFYGFSYVIFFVPFTYISHETAKHTALFMMIEQIRLCLLQSKINSNEKSRTSCNNNKNKQNEI